MSGSSDTTTVRPAEDGEERVWTALHVLPHPGGGGETYVDLLDGMLGYRFRRVVLAPGARPSQAARSILQRAVSANLASRRSDVFHVHGEIAASFTLPALARRPSVVTLHGTHLYRRLTAAARRAAAVNLRLIVATASRTICVSPVERDLVVAALGKKVTNRLVVIHNGVPTSARVTAEERRAARAEFLLADEDVVGLWLGGFDHHKDPLTAARAAVVVARTDARVKLVMVGDGPLRPEVERVAGGPEGDALRVLGPRADVRRVLATANFVVLSSRREGLSFALLEAMSLGLPAVVADAPENVAIVGDGGIVVSFGDVNGLARAVLQLAADSREMTTMGELARRRVELTFRADEMRRRTREVYDEVRAERSSLSLP